MRQPPSIQAAVQAHMREHYSENEASRSANVVLKQNFPCIKVCQLSSAAAERKGSCAKAPFWRTDCDMSEPAEIEAGRRWKHGQKRISLIQSTATQPREQKMKNRTRNTKVCTTTCRPRLREIFSRFVPPENKPKGHKDINLMWKIH